MNKVTNWFYKTPSEPGLYLVCYGDVETPGNIFLADLNENEQGYLVDQEGDYIRDYSGVHKFAKLSFKDED